GVGVVVKVVGADFSGGRVSTVFVGGFVSLYGVPISDAVWTSSGRVSTVFVGGRVSEYGSPISDATRGDSGKEPNASLNSSLLQSIGCGFGVEMESSVTGFAMSAVVSVLSGGGCPANSSPLGYPVPENPVDGGCPANSAPLG